MEEFFVLKKMIEEENHNEMMEIFKSNQLEKIQKLIDCGADININNCEPFRWNIKFGKIETIELLMFNKTQTSDLDELLNYACRYRELNIVELLVDLGADIFAPTNGQRLITYAVRNKKAEIVDFLCNNGLKISKNTTSYFQEALIQENKEMIRILIKNGMDLSYRKNQLLNEILKKEDTYPKLEMIKCFMENGLKINTIIEVIDNYKGVLEDEINIKNWCKEYQEKEILFKQLNKKLSNKNTEKTKFLKI